MTDYQPLPTPAQEESSTALFERATSRAVLAAFVSAALVLLGAPWDEMSAFAIPFLAFGLVDPASGFFPLSAALWLLFTVPGVLRGLARRRPRGGGAGVVLIPSRTRDAEGRRRLSVPRENLEDIEGEHRPDLAAALGIPWRDELFFDHEAWSAACREAAEERAASARR